MKNILLIISLILVATFSQAQSVIKTMLRLPDTGQIQSYTNTFGEDHDFTNYAPFFIANGDGTVSDTITGLMWQQTDGGEMTIENALDYCNNLMLAGFSDWRLPKADESFSILNHQFSNPALNSTVFSNSPAEYWWTSDRQANDSNKVWVTNAGGGIGNHPKNETISAGGTKKFHVRAVREAHSPVILQNRYTPNGTGTVTDNVTDLIWQRFPSADSLTWEDALSYADTLQFGGFNDWRLPNIKELRSISETRIINPSIDNSVFGVTTAGKFWSSTSLPNQPSKAWYLHTQYGITTYDPKTARHLILCVRNSQIANSIEENNAGELIVFPNPFQTNLSVKHNTGKETYFLTDLHGKKIYESTNIEQADFSNLPAGFYMLRASGDYTQWFKLIKR